MFTVPESTVAFVSRSTSSFENLTLAVRADGQVPSAGGLAVFCRPVVTASAVVRRDGTVLADGCLPDFVRSDGLERHLGDGVIEAAVDAPIAESLLRPRQRPRRRIMSYPPVIRLVIAMTLMPDAAYLPQQPELLIGWPRLC